MYISCGQQVHAALAVAHAGTQWRPFLTTTCCFWTAGTTFLTTTAAGGGGGDGGNNHLHMPAWKAHYELIPSLPNFDKMLQDNRHHLLDNDGWRRRR